MKNRVTAVLLTLLCGTLAFAGPFTAISQPTADYLAATTYIDASSIPNYSNVTSVSDGFLTVSFSPGVTKYTTPGTWATWSVAPESQRQSQSEPLPLFYTRSALLLTLSAPVMTFGLEAEPNAFQVYTITARFYDGSMSLLGTITRDVNGHAGARLFAATADSIQHVQLECGDPGGFGVGAIRYAPATVPEPGTWSLLALGAAAVGLLRRSRRS